MATLPPDIIRHYQPAKPYPSLRGAEHLVGCDWRRNRAPRRDVGHWLRWLPWRVLGMLLVVSGRA